MLVITRIRVPHKGSNVFIIGCLRKDMCFEITRSDLKI